MGLAQPDIPARRMANDRKVQLTDALVRVLVRFLTPVTVETELVHDSYWGGPPLGVQILCTFPTPKTGMEQIEQFNMSRGVDFHPVKEY